MTRGCERGVEPGAQVAAILTNTPLAVRGISASGRQAGRSHLFRSRRAAWSSRSTGAAPTLVEHPRPMVTFVDQAMIEFFSRCSCRRRMSVRWTRLLTG